MPQGTHIDPETCARMRSKAKSGMKHIDIADEHNTSDTTVRNHLYGRCSHSPFVDEGPLTPPATREQTTGEEHSYAGEWLDCSTGVVASGVQQNKSGQLTRLYYESYGNPADDVGEHDTGPETRRKIDLRAIEAIPFASDPTPTIIFRDETGRRYYRAPFNRIMADCADGDTSPTLAVRDGDELAPIGRHVALAIPDHAQMSPQLRTVTG